jgi:hypothetical protein
VIIGKLPTVALTVASAVLSVHATPAHKPTCGEALAAIRTVVAEGHIRVGYAHTGGGILATTPALWATQLRASGLVSLALTASHAYGNAGNAAYVEAVQATALAITSGQTEGTCTR